MGRNYQRGVKIMDGTNNLNGRRNNILKLEGRDMGFNDMGFNDYTQILNFFSQFGWEYNNHSELYWMFSRDED
mgnify:CR=1 FL=1|tara:strand:+ start:221 stop:439 length:219 start_codon:yes stop_codon:yes gene_type:complete